jgi:uncharacterized protein (TIGR03067 family)
MLVRIVAAVAAVALLAAPTAADDAADLKALQGTWAVTEVTGDVKNGFEDEVNIKEVTFTFTDNKLVIVGFEKKREFTIKLDSTKKPAAIDLTALAGVFKDKSNPAIYELKGDTLKMCICNKETTDRPTEFKGSKGSYLYVFTLTRAKK